jgi:hypothetical protein
MAHNRAAAQCRAVPCTAVPFRTIRCHAILYQTPKCTSAAVDWAHPHLRCGFAHSARQWWRRTAKTILVDGNKVRQWHWAACRWFVHIFRIRLFLHAVASACLCTPL